MRRLALRAVEVVAIAGGAGVLAVAGTAWAFYRARRMARDWWQA